MNFQKGQTVQLKSGGPFMTITHIADAGSIEATWFNNSDGVYTKAFGSFPAEALKLVEM